MSQPGLVGSELGNAGADRRLVVAGRHTAGILKAVAAPLDPIVQGRAEAIRRDSRLRGRLVGIKECAALAPPNRPGSHRVVVPFGQELLRIRSVPVVSRVVL